MNPWLVDLIVVRKGSHTSGERRALSRGAEDGVWTRVRQGVYVPTAAWNDGADGHVLQRARHIIRARALDAVSSVRPMFSHWTAAVLDWLPIMDASLDRVHVTDPDGSRRGLDGVLTHALPLAPEETKTIGGLLVTRMARTIVDIAGAAPFMAGVVTADGALFRGLPRELLDQAVDLAAPRRAATRIAAVAGFAHPGAESAAESADRVSMFTLGIEPQALQHEVLDAEGVVGRLDTYDRRRRIGTEVDGLEKYLDPLMAPQGAGRVVVKEKRREDRMRAELDGFARVGYWEARNPPRLLPILTRVGLHPAEHRPTLADWAAEARLARPRVRP